MEEKVSTKDHIFGLATYLLASARGCVDEPKLYGPLRLLEAISRLTTLAEHAECVEKDEFLLRAKNKIDANKHLVMESEQEFVSFLDELIREFTSDLKKRNFTP